MTNLTDLRRQVLREALVHRVDPDFVVVVESLLRLITVQEAIIEQITAEKYFELWQRLLRRGD